MSVEVIAHHVPRRRRPGDGEQAFQEGHVVRLGAAVANGAEDLAGGDIERRDQALGAMPDILELTPFDMPRLHRQGRGGALERLNAGHLVDRHGVHILFGGSPRRLVDGADVGALGVEFGVRLRRQPITAAMRLEVRIFLKSARRSHARYSGQCPGVPPDGPVRSGSTG